eukprot:CAMPEP_0197243344 /NCGR_PEP_ID=MMETSP1429-20130617/8834_1 /TAXON_ID=49237 /ORGANISM="Chaetoceros  sp., Strain UNC1202" /LENGTH=108 /DNA_ID=CAMNT_0042703555 /DNA_START=70 /DNA_END=392 /DNA_ORIENTATION=+
MLLIIYNPLKIQSQFRSLSVTFNAEDKKIAFSGSYGSHIGLGNEVGTAGYNQDFEDGGDIFVTEAGNKLTQFGNSWKTYELSEPYPVTINTRLKFNFEVAEEAEGHAV